METLNLSLAPKEIIIHENLYQIGGDFWQVLNNEKVIATIFYHNNNYELGFKYGKTITKNSLKKAFNLAEKLFYRGLI